MKLSEVINGFKNGHLIFVGGKPNSGKTTFALSLINDLCLEKGKTVIFFSLEMSKEMIVRRLLRIQTGITNPEYADDNEWGRLVEAANIVGTSKLILDDTPALSWEEVSETCRRMLLKMDVDMVIVDYLQLMSSENCKSCAEAVLKNIHELKRLANEIKRPIIVLSQFHSHKGKTTILDIQNFDKIKSDLDDIILLHKVAEEAEYNEMVELYVIKNSQEQSRELTLVLNPVKVCFEEMTSENQEF